MLATTKGLVHWVLTVPILFLFLSGVYLVHNMSKLPPRPALTMTGATFGHLESVLFISFLTQPNRGKPCKEKQHLSSDQVTWLAGGLENFQA